MWVCTVKVSQVVKSAGYHVEGMTLPQAAFSRRVPKGIVPSPHCGSTHCWRKGVLHSGTHKLLFFPPRQNKPKQIPKNKIIYVCHWVMRLSPCKTNAWQIVLGKAHGQATGCTMTVLNQTHGEGNFGDICTKIWTVLNFCKQIINAIVFNMKFLCEGSLYL